MDMFYLLLLYGLSCTLFETLQGLTCLYGEWENGILVSYVHVLCYQQVDFTPKCKPQRRESYQTLNNGLLQALMWYTNSSRLSPFSAAKVSTILYPTFFYSGEDSVALTIKSWLTLDGDINRVFSGRSIIGCQSKSYIHMLLSHSTI